MTAVVFKLGHVHFSFFHHQTNNEVWLLLTISLPPPKTMTSAKSVNENFIRCICSWCCVVSASSFNRSMKTNYESVCSRSLLLIQQIMGFHSLLLSLSSKLPFECILYQFHIFFLILVTDITHLQHLLLEPSKTR